MGCCAKTWKKATDYCRKTTIDVGDVASPHLSSFLQDRLANILESAGLFGKPNLFTNGRRLPAPKAHAREQR
jgi:hypothetical protein